MDFVDALINFFRVTDSSSLLNVNFETLRDKEQYLGERIVAFFQILILITLYIFIVTVIVYILFKLL